MIGYVMIGYIRLCLYYVKLSLGSVRLHGMFEL